MKIANSESNLSNDSSCCSHDGCHTLNDKSDKNRWKIYAPALFSFALLIMGILLDYFQLSFFSGWLKFIWYLIAYVPVGWPVLKSAWRNIAKGELFTEFSLMSIATIGAFALKEYPEGVAVMLFYSVGELFQEAAVKKARGNIQSLLDVRPKEALVYRNGGFTSINPEVVAIGEKIQVRVGEKIPLDGRLLSSRATVNTAAITGESTPRNIDKGEKLYAGSINLNQVIEMESTEEYKNSSISRILDLVQNATARKSKTELFIRKFARVYTPIIAFLAVALTFLPYVIVENYVFEEWFYRALIFLVISCPCALVISIPLGYFGGLGAASRNGILFKGASYLDAITKTNAVVLDKTGTLTKGVFKVKEIKPILIEKDKLIAYIKGLEAQSTHPIAKAINEYPSNIKFTDVKDVEEIAGKGLAGTIEDKHVLVGNKELFKERKIKLNLNTEDIVETLVLVAIDQQFAGYITLADELKADSQSAILKIRKSGISQIGILSGDKNSITQKVANELEVDWAKAELLPEDKLKAIEELKTHQNLKTIFVGDGINDAPVLAASDVGMAMGGLGSDVAIETADVIIQTDQPSKIAQAIEIGKSTRKIVWQNIFLAFGVKALVLALGAGGLATMWEAVFADVGVALLAILNAVRLQRMNWDD
ncbi:cadmium-translocating P-type ATPase [Euzebyella marina]|uniref:P-type Zn(2+) transporter n=1 Tax=Euzebyella marina TaxID=1761453 RepID=A0A3G2L8K0_9FLAO|nr:heavy metal translocating P-type ATPase [Euzebyella marina]AYN68597.1 cadmium-translocating P-type ATPase [Euzebyella marina]